MDALVFVDTNVFLYAVDDRNLAKQESARTWRESLWKSRRGRISYQVLQEFYVNVAAKWPKALPGARAEIRDLIAWQPIAPTLEHLENSWRLQERYRISFWDAAIVAAAKASQCAYLLTEDLPTDAMMDGVRIINPFTCLPGDLR